MTRTRGREKDPAPRIYEGDGDRLMAGSPPDANERLIIVPDALPSKTPDPTSRIRIMWGQHLLEDLLAGRYRSLICAVNAQDNRSGIIAQLAALLPSSQWDQTSISEYARQFSAGPGRVKVLKYDMDAVEVLAILRPAGQENLSLPDLSSAFKVIVGMLDRRTNRLPCASVSFLGARANQLLDANGREPAFESVLNTMYQAGYSGDVYPSPAMWHTSQVGLFARYPFAPTLDRLRDGGY
ncbi:MAG: hypothetical protein IT446_12525 [Phycisphaerales bacterium]|jgi:hypothetical protein|nr:hypothetical protein [Phycisphaerales bacterium]